MRGSSFGAAAVGLLTALALTSARAGDGVYKFGSHVADFTYSSETGKKVHLSDYRGKIVVLNFYASW